MSTRAPLRVTFALPAEGRGHMTQALALAHHLRAAGHRVEKVLVGLGPGWSVPPFFTEGIGAPVATFRCPTHSLDASRTAVSAPATVRDALLGVPAFLAAARRRRADVAEGTDVLVGFFDVVGGLSRALGRGGPPAVAVGHHYLLFHPRGPRPPLGWAARQALRAYTRITVHGAAEVLALSFSELGPATPGVADAPLRVVPPLLRPELTTLAPRDDGHLLAYAVTPGVGNRVVEWQRSRPQVVVHLYIAGGRDALRSEPGPGCHVHELDDRAFLAHMATCRAYAGSAGFESLCEAHYLGKPVLAVPTRRQVEQQLNAADAERAGVARAGRWSDLDAFWEEAASPDAAAVARFRDWVETGPARMVAAVERAAGASDD